MHPKTQLKIFVFLYFTKNYEYMHFNTKTLKTDIFDHPTDFKNF